jgi:esterase/lipase superfamily enzyme
MAEAPSRARALAPTVLAAIASCQTSTEALMPAPVLFTDGSIDPFAHLRPHEREPGVTVFYATERDRRRGATTRYGNGATEVLRLGRAVVQFGQEPLDWAALEAISLAPERAEPVTLGVGSLEELALLPADFDQEGAQRAAAPFLAALNARLDAAEDPEILHYVHGAKVDLSRCLERCGEFSHFAGRDLVPVVFDWPSHPNILAYLLGADVGRAERAAPALAGLIELLARHGRARRIHVLCYSAGARVTTLALSELHPRREPVTDEERAALRLGAAIFVAGDVPLEGFLAHAPRIHELTERISVLASDADQTAVLAERLMGSGLRLGDMPASLSASERSMLAQLPRLEVVDVSWFSEARGFDIGGHQYWYRHPWVSSDIILNLRTDLPATHRGLQATDTVGVWGLSPDFPERARGVARSALAGQR